MPGTSQGFTLAEAAELAAVVAALGVVTAIYKAAAARLRATVFSRRDLARRLNRMACGVTADYVTGLFGAPVFRRSISEILGELADVSERIYQCRHAWLQVIGSNDDDAVQSFSVTVTDPRFKFGTSHLTFDTLDIRIGATHFTDVHQDRDGWSLVIGYPQWRYSESFSPSDFQLHQLYILAYNDAGAGWRQLPGADTPDIRDPISEGRLSTAREYQPSRHEPLPRWLAPARDRTTINTLTVIGAAARADLVEVSAVDNARVGALRDPLSERHRDRVASLRIKELVRELDERRPPSIP
jgi:hypothetical protein